MKKVLVISKAYDDPSAYYRLIQYLKGHKNVRCMQLFSKKQYRNYYDRRETKAARAVLGIQAWIKIVFILLWDILFYRSETVIINRKIVPRFCPGFVAGILKKYLSSKYVVWDFDDHIFSNGEISRAEAEIYREAADRIVVTNEFLKSLLCADMQKRTDLLPTTDRDFENISIRDWNRVRQKRFYTEIHLIWVGTKGNLCYLDDMISQIDQAAGEMNGRTVILYIVSNMPYRKKTNHLRIKNIRWTREKTVKLMQKMHIGLMPLRENAFTKGKGAFKAVQYIGAGLPVIASPVGFNCNVIHDGENGFLTDSEWGVCLKRLVQSYNEWEKYSLSARARWEQDFHSNKNMEYWERMIR